MKRRWFLGLLALLLTGCASKYVIIDSDKKKEAYQLEVSTRSNDARAVINTGKVLKTWIKSYVSEDGYLVGAHDIYFYVESPGFKAGIQSPASGYKAGVIKENGKIPIYISPSETDRTFKNDKIITEYLKEINQKKRGEIYQDAKAINQGKTNKVGGKK